ncbi:hypothetical protein ZIOFF_038187 [Zingiber officinale]|uniref:Ubiquitin-like domain-containing protein n=1 Tax=Zingiber officinale TaxID=94328 RepID=A0A8J5GEA1_ZINOF|nr:hypothetical protein ZIOFF_038187 [Zingiber officinale]
MLPIQVEKDATVGNLKKAIAVVGEEKMPLEQHVLLVLGNGRLLADDGSALAEAAISEAIAAGVRDSGAAKKGTSRSSMAGLQFPLGFKRGILVESIHDDRCPLLMFSSGAGVGGQCGAGQQEDSHCAAAHPVDGEE